MRGVTLGSRNPTDLLLLDALNEFAAGIPNRFGEKGHEEKKNTLLGEKKIYKGLGLGPESNKWCYVWGGPRLLWAQFRAQINVGSRKMTTIDC